MTKFIDVSKETKKEKQETVFTHYQNPIKGWEKAQMSPSEFQTIKYLGKCDSDGDLFAAYSNGEIFIYKGTKGDEFKT